MNKIVILSCILLLTSCGATTDTTLGTIPFAGEGFSINIPNTWIAVDKATLPATTNGTIVLALTSAEIVSGYSNNMSIMKEKLTEAITSKKYSVVNYALTTGEYKEFVKLEEKVITF